LIYNRLRERDPGRRLRNKGNKTERGNKRGESAVQANGLKEKETAGVEGGNGIEKTVQSLFSDA